MSSSPSHSSNAGRRFTPLPAEEIATLLPGYEIQKFIGAGGMGAVYLARQRKLDRLVALKMLPPEMVASGDFAVRFQREAEALAQLDHPNLVALYDFGATRDAHLYIAMEYVDGPHLGELAASGELTLDEAIPVIESVCDALQYAHDCGIIHRDIKPSNILVTADGKAKIADFGLAKIIDPDADPENSLGDGRSTTSGTPQFMAPEQMVANGSIDHRADIYSLGSVLYLLLTGKLPIGAFYSPSSVNPELHFAYDFIIGRALRTKPDDRYASMAEMAEDLRLARTDPDQFLVRSKPVSSEKSSASFPWWIAVVAVVLVSFGVIVGKIVSDQLDSSSVAPDIGESALPSSSSAAPQKSAPLIARSALEASTTPKPVPPALPVSQPPSHDAANSAETVIFRDDFDRNDVGENYIEAPDSFWTIQQGALHSSFANNNRLLRLRQRLPENVRIEFTAWEESGKIDIKTEIFGDGKSQRAATGYSLIQGGWDNKRTGIFKQGEQQSEGLVKRIRWEENKKYRWRIERRDSRKIELFIDDTLICDYPDPLPLLGPEHVCFSFNNYRSLVYFDDLVITRLGPVSTATGFSGSLSSTSPPSPVSSTLLKTNTTVPSMPPEEPPPPLPSLPEFEQIHRNYLNFRQTQVIQPIEEARSLLDQQYTHHLGRKITSSSSESLSRSYQEEIDRVTKGEIDPFLETPDSLVTDLIELRETYRWQRLSLVSEKEEKLKDAMNRFVLALKQSESQLTQADRIEDALTLREYREYLEKQIVLPPKD